MSVIYDDDDIQALWHAASSDYLLVTFDHREARPDGRRFFADHVAKWKGISTLGLVAKSANFYPARSVRRVAEVFASERARFKQVVLLGLSMGGYGVIKFSNLFGADTLVAINPSWADESKDEMRDAVAPPKGSGRGRGKRVPAAPHLFVLTDNLDRVERGNMDKVRGLGVPLSILPFPGAGHAVMYVMSPIEATFGLVTGAKDRRMGELYALARRFRRSNVLAVTNLMSEVALRHPRLASAVRFPAASPPSNGTLARNALAAEVKGERIRLRTYHGTVVFYNFVTERCEHLPLDRLASAPSLGIEIAGDLVSLHVEVGGLRQAIWLSDSLELTVNFRSSHNPSVLGFHLKRTDTGLYLVHQGKYLCAGLDGRLVFDRDQPDIWERFSLSR